MSPADFQQSQSEIIDDQSAIDCSACQSALDPEGQQTVSFLLLDHLRIPVLSCDDHLEQFTSICGLTSNDTATLLHHQPAGGISCPGCRFASYSAAQSTEQCTKDNDGVDETQSVSFAHKSFALVNAVSPPYSLPSVAP